MPFLGGRGGNNFYKFYAVFKGVFIDIGKSKRIITIPNFNFK